MADHALATITNPSAALTDFSLIVDLSRMPASWWSAVTSTDGTRGRVYKGDGTTRLAADWIDFDDTAETGLLRVLWSGTLATTGTQELWIEPPVTGNAAVLATDTYGSDNAYDGSWERYYPLTDATDRITGSSLTLVGDASLESGTGPYGGQLAVDGNGDYASDTSITMTEFTVMVWHKASWSSWAGPVPQLMEEANVPTDDLSLSQGHSFNANPMHYVDDGTHRNGDSSTWHHLVGVLDSTVAGSAIILDGVSLALTELRNTGLVSQNCPVRLGTAVFPDFEYANGLIGPTQYHSTTRSADWISSEYDQTNDQSTFWGTWSWETSGGGTTYSVSASDGISLSDSPSGALTLTASVADGVSLADSPSGALRITASVSDGVSFADSSGGASTIPLTVADAIVLSDEVLTAFTFGVQASDGVTLSDQATEGGVIQVTVSDGIVFADSASAVLRILKTISDGVVFSDEASATGTISATVSDGVTFSDAVTTALRVVASVSDGVRLSDVAIDSTFLPVGRVQIRVTTAQASVTITAKQPGVNVAFE